MVEGSKQGWGASTIIRMQHLQKDMRGLMVQCNAALELAFVTNPIVLIYHSF